MSTPSITIRHGSTGRARWRPRRPPAGGLGARRASLLALLAAAAGAAASPTADAATVRRSLVAADDMTLGAVTRTAVAGCDAPTPVRASDRGVYSNVSDCSPVGTRISSGWERIDPSTAFVATGLTAYGSGAGGKKLSGALVDGGVLYLIQRNLTTSGTGLRVGRSASVAKPVVTWAWSTPDFGWASFAQASPDGYAYLYLRDSRSAYGTADRVDLARVRAGSEASLAAWQVFSGSQTAPAWVPWANRAARAPVLTDPGQINRPNVSYLGGCWTMAVTAPGSGGSSGGAGGGLAVYTSSKPYGPWKRRYHQTGVDLGESAQFSPLWPGRLLTTRGDRFEWHSYTMPAGC